MSKKQQEYVIMLSSLAIFVMIAIGVYNLSTTGSLFGNMLTKDGTPFLTIQKPEIAPTEDLTITITSGNSSDLLSNGFLIDGCGSVYQQFSSITMDKVMVYIDNIPLNNLIIHRSPPTSSTCFTSIHDSHMFVDGDFCYNSYIKIVPVVLFNKSTYINISDEYVPNISVMNFKIDTSTLNLSAGTHTIKLEWAGTNIKNMPCDCTQDGTVFTPALTNFGAQRCQKRNALKKIVETSHYIATTTFKVLGQESETTTTQNDTTPMISPPFTYIPDVINPPQTQDQPATPQSLPLIPIIFIGATSIILIFLFVKMRK